MQRLKVMISSAGRRVELLRCFRESAEELGVELEVLAVDQNPEMSSACRMADVRLRVPNCCSEEFEGVIKVIVEEYEPDIIIPTIDPELVVYGGMDLRVLMGEKELMEIFNDKYRTVDFLKEHGVRVPQTYLLTDKDIRYPLFVKPLYGSASKGVFVAEESKDLVGLGRDYIGQEVLVGEEYTVNMYFDNKGKGRCVIPHLRQEVRSGEVSKGKTIRNEEVEAIGWKLAEVLKGRMLGPLCFQVKQNVKGEWCVFDVNPRFGGGYPLAHRAGGKFTKWILEELLGRESTSGNEWESGMQMLRYDAAVFI